MHHSHGILHICFELVPVENGRSTSSLDPHVELLPPLDKFREVPHDQVEDNFDEIIGKNKQVNDDEDQNCEKKAKTHEILKLCVCPISKTDEMVAAHKQGDLVKHS